MTTKLLTCVVAMLAALGVSRAGATTTTPSLPVTYPAGWNMVAGTPGTNLSPLGTVYSYSGSGYASSNAAIVSDCTGYWAQLAQATTLQLYVPPEAASGSYPPPFGSAVTCSLNPGWTLVGNPLPGAALLQPGAVGWWWNPQTGVYELSATIKLGGALWIYSAGQGAITLYFAPADTVAINRSLTRQQMHVGQHVAVLAAGTGTTVIAGNLVLEAAVTVGDAAQPVQLWLFQANAVGIATIVIQLPCEHAHPPCLIPDFIIEIDVVP
jgi:hypothetical protein